MDSQMLGSVQAAGRSGEFVGFRSKEQTLPGIGQFDVVQGLAGYPEEVDAYIMLTFKPRPPKPAVLSRLSSGEGAFGRIFETTRTVDEYQVIVELRSAYQFPDAASVNDYVGKLLAAQERGEGTFLLTDGRRNFFYLERRMMVFTLKPGKTAWECAFHKIGLAYLEQGERIFCRP